MELEVIPKGVLSNIGENGLTLLRHHQKVLENPRPTDVRSMPQTAVWGRKHFSDYDGRAESLPTGFIAIAGTLGILVSSIVGNANKGSEAYWVFMDPWVQVSAMVMAIGGYGMAAMDRKNGRTPGKLFQQLWRKMGLPTPALDRVEMEHRLAIRAYYEQLNKHSKMMAKAKRKTDPILSRLNQTGNERTFSFGENGVKITNQVEDSDILKTLRELSHLKK